MSVLLTGASGFIAAVILDELVKKKYKIVATVRNQDKADWINKLYPNADISISIVSEIADEGAFDQTFKDHPDIEYVLHTASPFYYGHSDPEKEILGPAINGTVGILHTIKKYGPNVRHVVVTSSFVSMLNSYTWPARELYTENSWNPITYEDSLKPQNTYFGSKKFAEKALWEFMDQHKPSFTASTVNPSLVLGPGLHKVDSAEAINTSNKPIYNALHVTEEASQNLRGTVLPFVNVKDVAAAHVMAIENPEVAAGKRWLLNSGNYDDQLLLDTIHKVVPELKGKIPIGKPYSANEIKELEQTKGHLIDTSAVQKQTGIKFIGLEQTVADAVKFFQKLDEQWGTSV